MTTLHIHAQLWEHQEAYIAGSKEELLKLRAAIDQALETNTAKLETYTSDGEGYSLIVMVAESTCLPYTDSVVPEGSSGTAPYKVYKELINAS